jgi:hypothetical protein
MQPRPRVVFGVSVPLDHVIRRRYRDAWLNDLEQVSQFCSKFGKQRYNTFAFACSFGLRGMNLEAATFPVDV